MNVSNTFCFEKYPVDLIKAKTVNLDSTFNELLLFSGRISPVFSRLHYSNCVFSVTALSDIKKLYRLTGVDNKPTVFLFNDTQIVDESFLEDINNILSSGEVPNLYKQDEFVEVCFIFIRFIFVYLQTCVGNM